MESAVTRTDTAVTVFRILVASLLNWLFIAVDRNIQVRDDVTRARDPVMSGAGN